MFRSRRRRPIPGDDRAPRRGPDGDRFRGPGDPTDGGPFVEEADPAVAPVETDWAEDEWIVEDPADDEGLDWDADEFTQTGEPEDSGDGRRARPTDLPEAGPTARTIVSTLLSSKPRRGAVAAVVWTLSILFAFSALYWWGPADLAAALPASGETVLDRGEAWRLLTAMAAHADAIHLLSNTVFLTWLIYLSFGAFGPSLYPWTAVPMAALSLAVTLEGYPPNIRVVGASGLLYLLAGSWLTLYCLIERRLSVPKRLLRVIGFFLVVLVPTSIRPEVSYRAHGIGLFFGICLGLAYFLARRHPIRQAERWEWEET